jgi:hypothetical protein
MKVTIVLMLLVVANCAFQCETGPMPMPDESGYCSDVSWLRAIIESAQEGPHKAEVIRYSYNGETVYLINTCKDCADTMDQVYNCSGQVICQFGGIAGLNTCPDFEDKAKNKKVIWKN